MVGHASTKLVRILISLVKSDSRVLIEPLSYKIKVLVTRKEMKFLLFLLGEHNI